MKPINNIKTIVSKLFINIYEFSSVFRDEREVFRKFRKDRELHIKGFRKDESNT